MVNGPGTDTKLNNFILVLSSQACLYSLLHVVRLVFRLTMNEASASLRGWLYSQAITPNFRVNARRDGGN